MENHSTGSDSIGAWHAGMLSAAHFASINGPVPFSILNNEHPLGKSKAKWFDQALGFTKDNAADLAKQIKFDEVAATVTDTTQHGTKYNQTITVTGANGKVIDVTFAWIKNNDGVVRLVTAIPTSK